MVLCPRGNIRRNVWHNASVHLAKYWGYVCTLIHMLPQQPSY